MCLFSLVSPDLFFGLCLMGVLWMGAFALLRYECGAYLCPLGRHWLGFVSTLHEYDATLSGIFRANGRAPPSQLCCWALGLTCLTGATGVAGTRKR